jgi:hypothetical protein
MRELTKAELDQVSGANGTPMHDEFEGGVGVVSYNTAKGEEHGEYVFSGGPPAGGWGQPYYGFNTGGAKPFWGIHH